ncbi:MAG: glycosyltransferase family 9 protein, partial [Ignavibacteriales bacterium]|nr:glycosyltransferase family 9 protein [Ignavibacteriales bacterium]
MPDCKKILVFHTAFLGDVILNLPMVQILKRRYPDAEIDVAAIPNAAQVLQNHPAIHSVIEYDKRGSDRGVKGIFKITSLLRRRKYDLALVSHRSLRSALIVAGAGIPQRICFSKSAGRWLFTDVVPYNRDLHEIERNISLLSPLGIRAEKRELPSVYPSSGDCATVDRILQEHQIDGTKNSVAVAPGSVWATKRWPADSYADLVRRLLDHGLQALLIGSAGDRELCAYIQQRSEAGSVQNFAGELIVLQSAELIRRCSVLVSNDSAPA